MIASSALKPWAASKNFTRVRLFVKSMLASGCRRFGELEVLDDVRDVNFRAFDLGLLPTHHRATCCRTNEGATFQIFAVAWLFADYNDTSRRHTFFSEDRLRCVQVQVTRFASPR